MFKVNNKDWYRSGVIFVNFDYNPHLFFRASVEFEQVNACWIIPSIIVSWSGSIHFSSKEISSPWHGITNCSNVSFNFVERFGAELSFVKFELGFSFESSEGFGRMWRNTLPLYVSPFYNVKLQPSPIISVIMELCFLHVNKCKWKQTREKWLWEKNLNMINI